MTSTRRLMLKVVMLYLLVVDTSLAGSLNRLGQWDTVKLRDTLSVKWSGSVFVKISCVLFHRKSSHRCSNLQLNSLGKDYRTLRYLGVSDLVAHKMTADGSEQCTRDNKLLQQLKGYLQSPELAKKVSFPASVTCRLLSRKPLQMTM
jgi:hypothetical protein